MERKFIIALTISLTILMTYNFLMGKYYPQESAQPIATQEVAEVRPPVATPAPTPAPVTSVPDEAPTEPENDIILETPNNIYTFTDRGGAIKKITLRDSLYIIDASGLPVRMASLHLSPPYTSYGDAKCETTKTRNGISFKLSSPDKLAITKEYIFGDDGRSFSLMVTFTNIGPETINFQYDITAASGAYLVSPLDKRYIEANSILDGKLVKSNTRKAPGLIQSGVVSVVGLRSKYFSCLLKPLTPASGFIAGRITKDKKLVSMASLPPRSLSPGISLRDEFFYYAGPNDSNLVKPYGLGLENAIDYGKLRGLERIFVAGLKFFYSVSKNWGISIILLTLAISLALYPFTKNSIRSMHKMQTIQPKVTRLREELKGDPQRLNQELMQLYKKEHVNPLGGCLPLFVQMPVFIAFYQTLFKFLGFNGAGFLWIKDLSAPDRMPLPFTLPVLGNTINILPILMAAMTFIQQKSAIKHKATVSEPYQTVSKTVSKPPQRQEPDIQQQMAVMMPILFGILFYKLPSGLVLYWFTNTLIMFIHQVRLRKL